MIYNRYMSNNSPDTIGIGYQEQKEVVLEKSPIQSYVEELFYSVLSSEAFIKKKQELVATGYLRDYPSIRIEVPHDSVIGPHVKVPKEEDGSSAERIVVLPALFLGQLSVWLQERVGKELRPGHIMAILMHEALHPGEFKGHTEEYLADEAAAKVLLDLGYCREDTTELLRAVGPESEKVRISHSHPSIESRIASVNERLADYMPDSVFVDTGGRASTELPVSVRENISKIEYIQKEHPVFSMAAEEVEQLLLSSGTIDEFWGRLNALDTRLIADEAYAEYEREPRLKEVAHLVLAGRALENAVAYRRSRTTIFSQLGEKNTDSVALTERVGLHEIFKKESAAGRSGNYGAGLKVLSANSWQELVEYVDYPNRGNSRATESDLLSKKTSEIDYDGVEATAIVGILKVLLHVPLKDGYQTPKVTDPAVAGELVAEIELCINQLMASAEGVRLGSKREGTYNTLDISDALTAAIKQGQQAEFIAMVRTTITSVLSKLIADLESDTELNEEDRQELLAVYTNIADILSYQGDVQISQLALEYAFPEVGGVLAKKLDQDRLRVAQRRGVSEVPNKSLVDSLSPELYLESLSRAYGYQLVVSHQNRMTLSVINEEFAHSMALTDETMQAAGIRSEAVSQYLRALSVSLMRGDFSTLDEYVQQLATDDSESILAISRYLKTEEQKNHFARFYEPENYSDPIAHKLIVRSAEDRNGSGNMYSPATGGEIYNLNWYITNCIATGCFKAIVPESRVIHYQSNPDDRRIDLPSTLSSLDSSERTRLEVFAEIFEQTQIYEKIARDLEERKYSDRDRFQSLLTEMEDPSLGVDRRNEISVELKKYVSHLGLLRNYEEDTGMTIKQCSTLLENGILNLELNGQQSAEFFIRMVIGKGWPAGEGSEFKFTDLVTNVIRSRFTKLKEELAKPESQDVYYKEKEYTRAYYFFADIYTKYENTLKAFSHLSMNGSGSGVIDFFNMMVQIGLPLPPDELPSDLIKALLLETPEELEKLITSMQQQGLITDDHWHNSRWLENGLGNREVLYLTKAIAQLLPVGDDLTVVHPTDAVTKGKLAYWWGWQIFSASRNWKAQSFPRASILAAVAGLDPIGIWQAREELEEKFGGKTEIPEDKDLFHDWYEAREIQFNLFMQQKEDRKRYFHAYIQQEIINKYNGFESVSDFKGFVDNISSLFPWGGTYNDELIAYGWALFEYKNQNDAELNQQVAEIVWQRISKDPGRWSKLTLESFKPTAGRAIFGRHSSQKTGSTEHYDEHIIGSKFFAEEIYANPSLRRIAFESGIEWPFNSVSGPYEGMDQSLEDIRPAISSFIEYFIGRQLLAVDKQLRSLAAAGDYAGALDLVGQASSGTQLPVTDVYVEYLLRKALLSDKYDSGQISTIFVEKFKSMTPRSREESGLEGLFLQKLTEAYDREVGAAANPLLVDYHAGLDIILDLMPEPSYLRNRFLIRLQTHALGITVEQIKNIEGLLADNLGIAEGTQREEGKPMSWGMLEQLNREQKGQLLIYLIGREAQKPNGSVFSEYEKNLNTDLRHLREDFHFLSDIERFEIVKRLVYGPVGALSPVNEGDEIDAQKLADNRREFAIDLVGEFVPKKHQHSKHYHKILPEVLCAISPHKAATVIANIINERIKLESLDTEISVEDMLYIAVTSYGSVGIKAAQLILDYPWVPSEIKESFSRALFNAEIVRPAVVLDVFEREKRAGRYSGFNLESFHGPAGQAGISQAYWVDLVHEDGVKQRVVYKSVRPAIISAIRTKDDIADLQIILERVRDIGYNPEIPSDLTEIVRGIISEERLKAFETEYLQSEPHFPGFAKPKIIGSGLYSILVEGIAGQVLYDLSADSKYADSVIRYSLHSFLANRYLNVDPHLGNFIHKKGFIYDIDGGFSLDERENPELFEASRNLLGGLLLGDNKSFKQACEFFGLPLNAKTGFGRNSKPMDRINVFRSLLLNHSGEDGNAITLHKMLWWLYRIQSLYNSLDTKGKTDIGLHLLRSFGMGKRAAVLNVASTVLGKLRKGK